MKNRFLISGVKRGIGRFIFDELGGKGFGRETGKAELDKLIEEGAETIIHCAFGRPSENHEEDFILTEKLAKAPHERFVYFSSVDVYPDNNNLHKECEEIKESRTKYGSAKLVAEKIVLDNSENPTILRCSGLLGKYARKNNLLRLIYDESPELSLTSDSELNVVLYEDVLKFILASNENQSIYNIASSKNASINEIAKRLKRDPKYGEFKYCVGNIYNARAKCLNLELNGTSLEAIEKFIR